MTTMTDMPPDSTPNRWLAGITARAVAGGLAALAFFILLALTSHSAMDPSFWNASARGTQNWLGALGANLSAAAFMAMGYSIWLVPFALALWAWRLWSGRWDRLVAVPLRLVPSGILALLSTSAFLSAMPGKMESVLGYGGWIGDRLILPFARMFETLGFAAPYQVPGLLFAICALVAFMVAVGTTRAEALWNWRYIVGAWRDTFAREKRQQFRDNTLSRASDLTKRLKGTLPVVENPPRLDGRIPVSAPQRAVAQDDDIDVSDDAEKPAQRKRATPKPSGRKPVQQELPLPGVAQAEKLLSLLAPPARKSKPPSPEELETRSTALLKVLNDYGVSGEIVDARQGPVVTLHEFEPAAGTKAARVVGLADDIARSMSALAARVAPVRGRSVIGIEMPNEQRETVYLREIMEKVVTSSMPLPLALGKEIDGSPRLASLAKMPHLLIAGTTGSGKSVGLNAMILSLLFRHPPEECRLIMIDPKMLELSVYDGIPHLMAPVVTDPKKAVMALKWVVREMENRYQKMATANVRNLEGYNLRMRAAIEAGEKLSRETMDEFGNIREESIEPETLPYIVVVVDEMADLMMVAGKEIEACIQRLAQMARASGIHLIMATQRPSVDVITGTIKANFPTRISFQVTSKIDSRTILGEMGAEQLLGQGDMLYMAGGGRVTRIHGPFVSDDEVHRLADEMRRYGAPDKVVEFDEPSSNSSEIDELLGLGSGSDDDALYDQAVAIVGKDRRATTSYIQRRLQIGYNRAARLIEAMEEQGVISPPNSAGKREILIESR